MMNVECTDKALEELTTNFRYNDAVLRHLVIREDRAIIEESPIMKTEKDSRERKSRREEQEQQENAATETAKAATEEPVATATDAQEEE